MSGAGHSLKRFLQIGSLLRGNSPTRSVAQGFTVRIAVLAVNVATGIITARALGPNGRGEQAAISLWPILLAGLVSFGLPTALTYEMRRRPERNTQYLIAGIFSVVVIGVVTSVVGFAAMPTLLSKYSPTLIRTAEQLMLFLPLILLSYLLRAVYAATMQFFRINISLLCLPLLTLIGLVLLVIGGRLTPITAAWCYYLPIPIITAWMFVDLWPSINVVPRSLLEHLKQLFQYGIRAYGFDIILALSTQMDQALIVGLLSARDLGLYAVALTLSRLVTMVHQSVNLVLFTSVIGLPKNDITSIVTRSARISNVLAVAGAGILVLLIPWAVPLFYGHAYDEVLSLTRILTIDALLAGMASVLLEAFAVLGRPFTITLIQAAWLLATIGFLILLVPRMKLEGAAIALVASSAIRLSLVLLGYRYVLNASIPQVIPISSDFRYIGNKIRNLYMRT